MPAASPVSPSVPPPPQTLTMMQQQQEAPTHARPPSTSQSHPSFAAAPDAGLATLASAPPAAPAADVTPPGFAAAEPKKPAVDPKLAIALPLGIFAVFVLLSLFVVLYALVVRPRTGAAPNAESPAAVTPP